MKFNIRLNKTMSSSEKINELRKVGNKVSSNVYISDNVEIVCNEITIGSNVIIDGGTKLVANSAMLGDNVHIGGDSDIRANKLIIDNNTKLGKNLKILVAEKMIVGRNSFFAESCEIICRSADINEGFFCEHNVIIGGGGGATGPHSKLQIGRYVHIGEFSVLNTARPLKIGNEAGIGAHVMLYTHGMWPPILEGYPVSFGEINIGDKAWITGRNIVLPGTNIGAGAVVAMGSVVNNDLPDRCLAGGVPVKVLKENLFGQKLSEDKTNDIISKILKRYVSELKFKEIEAEFNEIDDNILIQTNEFEIGYTPIKNHDKEKDIFNYSHRIIILNWGDKKYDTASYGELTIFNLKSMEISGCIDKYSEDLRDFLRRNCIRFYTENRFQSIIPPAFNNLLKE